MTSEAPLDPAVTIKPPIVTANGWLAFGVAAAAIVADQLSKAWIVHGVKLELGQSLPVLPFFSLTGVLNPGVSFGMLRADSTFGRVMLILFALVVVSALAFWARKAERRMTAVALGLVMGGAIGNNLIDRIRLGHVIDFLDFSGLHFPWVFNVADSAISVGVVLLLLDTLQPQARPAT
jgi:signal peptidase II